MARAQHTRTTHGTPGPADRRKRALEAGVYVSNSHNQMHNTRTTARAQPHAAHTDPQIDANARSRPGVYASNSHTETHNIRDTTHGAHGTRHTAHSTHAARTDPQIDANARSRPGS